MGALMVVWPAFVVVPENGTDWYTNARITGGVIVWAAAVLAALGVISKVPLWRSSKTGERMTVGRIVGRMFRYVFAEPFGRFLVAKVRDANADQFDMLRSENTEQHAETSQRLSAVEVSVKSLADRVDALEQVVNPAGIVQDLVEKMTELSETVRTDRHNARNAMGVLSGSVELLTDEIRQMRTGS